MTIAERNNLSQLLSNLEAAGDAIRKTADELANGKIHPAHAANRLRKIAVTVDGKDVKS